MLGTDKGTWVVPRDDRADFLGGANLDNGNPEILPQTIQRFFKFLPGNQKHVFLEQMNEQSS
jgi:hypothetical protein